MNPFHKKALFLQTSASSNSPETLHDIKVRCSLWFSRAEGGKPAEETAELLLEDTQEHVTQ
jgi:hypothetical protein